MTRDDPNHNNGHADGGYSFQHSNPVTAAGFTMIPNVIMLSQDLSAEAKLVYGYLKHLAWRNGAEQTDPPREILERDLGLTEKRLTRALRELREYSADQAGGDVPLITVIRRGQGQTNIYVVHDPESRIALRAELEKPVGRFPARARSLPYKPSKTTTEEPPRRPPQPKKVDGKPVTVGELRDATEILEAFNEVAGTRYKSADWLGKIVMRLREHPDITPDQHRAVIVAAFLNPWWKDAPSPSVVYGNAGLFERAALGARDQLERSADIDGWFGRVRERQARDQDTIEGEATEVEA